MGNTYTRQSTFTDGDVITADLFNNEYDQLLAAFAASTGHTHDGTAAEGGPITKLLGTNITIGDATSGTDITVTFDGESNDGVFKWMEDEDYFEFSDDILIASTEKLQFRDTAIYINSSADGQLDIVADTEIQLAATTIDINGLVDISGNLSVGGNLDVTGTFDLSDANFTNAGDISLDSISGDADSNTSITFSGSDVITITTGGETQVTFNNGSILPTTDDDVDLGSSALQFKDLYIDGTANIDTGSIDTANVGALTVSGSTTLAATSFGDADITNVGSIALDTITNDGTDITLDSSGDIILDADGADVFLKDAGTTYGSLTNSSGNLVIKSGTTTALTFSGANATIAGDLTISGDDLIMGTNTSGHILVADGTNFNPVAVTDLSEISTAADGDVFLAVDASGGGLKKITRSTVIAGTGVAGNISNIVEDTSPQLGGNLDTNSQNILIDDAHFIGDENGNEQIIFQTTSSAVNQFDVTNAASGSAPKLSATGGDSNIDLEVEAKGTGHVTVRGNTNSGAIQFNCESNSHGQIVIAQPHSASVTNTMLLPAGANSTLVSLVSTDTLTNKTLTSPKINEDVAVTSTATEINVLDGITAVVGELNALDIGSTAVGTAVASKAVILDSNKDYTGIRNFTITGNLSVAGTTTTVDTVTMEAANAIVFEGATADAHETTLTIVDPTADRTINLPNQSGTIPVLAAASNTAITSTPAEINVLDGITAVVGELNALDIGSTAVGTAVASKAVILDSNKDYTGIRNLTISGEIDAATGDYSGAVDVAGALTTAAITASGIIKTDDTTAATSTTDGSLQTDGGLSVVLDAVIGDDLLMLSDASVIHFGADSEVTLTHVADVGLALKHTATADDKPIVLTLQTGETDMAANDVIGKLAFQAPDEGTGTDAILVAAAVQAVAEGNFSSSNNATRLEFHTGASELAAVKMTLNSTGAVKPVTYQETYVSLSAASTVDCPLLTANHFAVTLDQNTTFTFSDPPASGTSFAFTLIVTQHSTAVTLTWPASVDWAGGSAPDAAGNNEVQAYGFITRDGGTTYYGFLGGTAIG